MVLWSLKVTLQVLLITVLVTCSLTYNIYGFLKNWKSSFLEHMTPACKTVVVVLFFVCLFLVNFKSERCIMLFIYFYSFIHSLFIHALFLS